MRGFGNRVGDAIEVIALDPKLEFAGLIAGVGTHLEVGDNNNTRADNAALRYGDCGYGEANSRQDLTQRHGSIGAWRIWQGEPSSFAIRMANLKRL